MFREITIEEFDKIVMDLSTYIPTDEFLDFLSPIELAASEERNERMDEIIENYYS